jgi:hypothetical protein
MEWMTASPTEAPILQLGTQAADICVTVPTQPARWAGEARIPGSKKGRYVGLSLDLGVARCLGIAHRQDVSLSAPRHVHPTVCTEFTPRALPRSQRRTRITPLLRPAWFRLSHASRLVLNAPWFGASTVALVIRAIPGIFEEGDCR